MRIRHGLASTLLAFAIGALFMPLARIPMPLIADWSTYTNAVWFQLCPLPAACLFAQLARRTATTLEKVATRRERTTSAAGTVLAIALSYPTVLLPSLSHPVPHAIRIGLIEHTTLTTCMAIMLMLRIPWIYAWLPSILIIFATTTQARPHHVLDTIATTHPATWTAACLLSCVACSTIGRTTNTIPTT